MAEMFIGELAAQLGLNPRTLRYYEALDLLPKPARTMNGYRVYGEETAQRLTFITKAKSLGLTLKEIGQILALRDSGKLPCSSVQQILQEHVERIDCQIAQLHALKVDLTALLNGWRSERRCSGKATSGCICPRIEAHGLPQNKSNATRKEVKSHDKNRLSLPKLQCLPHGRD
jgi:DNA-binding transcriptional MerR regulator